MSVYLNGLWRYTAEDHPQFSKPAFNDSSWKTMSIPANWFLGGLDHHGVVWFRHEFRHRPRVEYTALHFNGVDYFADVYLNGEHLGHHTGYFDPFAFDVTKILRSGKNILAVRVDSPYETPGPDGWHLRKRLIKGVLNHHDCRPGGGWEPVGQSYNTGGIWNRVYLEQHGAVTIDRLLLRADMDSRPPTLHAELTVWNRTRKRRARLEVRCTPENFKARAQTAGFTLELPEGESVHSILMPVNDVRPWQPWDRGFPHLYEVSASLVAARETISRSSLFGFRTIRVEAGFHWFINGQSYFLRGSNYLPSQWLAETLFPEAARGKEHPFGGGAGGDFYSRDVALAKQANLNILRVHAHVLPPEFHEACDRAGLLVWQDFPFQWGYSDEPEFHAEAERQMRAMITGLYNHPSIAAWCCHNESPWDAPWMAGQAGGLYDPAHNRDLDARLEVAARELDPGRYVHRNSGTGDGHVYPGWYVGQWRDFQNAPGAPFVTEYGAQGLPVRQNVLRMLPQFGPDAGYAELARFKGWLDSQKKISATTKTLIKFGTFLWNLTEKNHWKSMQEWMKGWGIKIERSTYKNIPPVEKTPEELRHAREVWETWRFHDFQPAETFDNGIALGVSLDQFIANSQAYQSYLIQYATECYRRAKYTKVTGIFQFDFSDPWPAMTWSVVDYWRTPKPAFDALRRSMQPVLPCFRLPENMEAGKAILISFCIVNDLTQAFPSATCEWRLEGGIGAIASATFPVDIPADSISVEAKLTLPSLGPGKYKLLVTVTSSRKTLGENWYELTVQ
ncbi:MAG TPA: glycoside hydrolase family 2 TIM barrel-domain containing protein [Anaerolineales bacterium]